MYVERFLSCFATIHGMVDRTGFVGALLSWHRIMFVMLSPDSQSVPRSYMSFRSFRSFRFDEKHQVRFFSTHILPE